MTGRLEKIELPAHWKNPNAKLKNQDESGPSGSVNPRTDAAGPAAPAPAHTPGQDAPVMLHGPSRFRAEHERNPSSESGIPLSDMRVSPRSTDSSLPSWIEGGEGGTPPSNTPSSAGSGSVNDIFALLGGGRIRNWNELSASLNRADDYSPRLDNNPLIARHLDPDVASPVQRRKVLWTRLPGPDHPLFGEYMAVHNPAFYPSRLAERASQPMAGRQAHEAAPADDRKAGLRRTHSMPGDLPHLSRPAECETVAGDRAEGTSPHEPEIRSEAGDGAEPAARPLGEARTGAGGDRPPGSAHGENSGAVEARLEDLTEENARLRKRLKEATTRAIMGGIAAAGAGLAAGLLIESMTGSPGSGQSGNPPANPTGNI